MYVCTLHSFRLFCVAVCKLPLNMHDICGNAQELLTSYITHLPTLPPCYLATLIPSCPTNFLPSYLQYTYITSSVSTMLPCCLSSTLCACIPSYPPTFLPYNLLNACKVRCRKVGRWGGREGGREGGWEGVREVGR